MTPRVVYWTNIPAPYMVDRFNALVRRGNLDFEAWFTSRTEEGRSWNVDEREWEFRHWYLPGARGKHHALVVPPRLLRGAAPDVMVSLYASPAYFLGSLIAARRGARTALWVEVTFDSWIKRRRWKEQLKSVLFPRSDAIFTPGADGRDFAMRYGASPHRIMFVPHVVDGARYSRQSSLEPDERSRVRDELGLRGVTFIYVGRLWRAGKGLDYLIDAFAALQTSSTDDTSLLLVGDGGDEDELRSRCVARGAENVVFAGFHDADALPRLYAASDIFVFPTLGDTFGMVVSEAMACGLPVIATAATGEIRERVSEGVNGFIVPPADSTMLCARMAVLAGDAALRQRMGEASSARVADQSPDTWAQAFEEGIARVLESPRVSNGEVR